MTAFSRASPPLDELESSFADQQGAGPDERRDLDLGRGHDLHPVKVPEGLDDLLLVLLRNDDQGALLDATALAGKRSLRLTAVLKLMRRA